MANITFGNYSPEEEKDTGEIEIRLGVFFDGTLNNERNTYIRLEKEKKKKGLKYDEKAVKQDPWGFDKDSYLNDYSNVARMYHFYTSASPIYIEGIGTLNGDTDTTAGYVTGMGVTGIRAKVRKGCEKVKEKISANTKVNITLDVFGFSRGAAAARAFVNEIIKPGYNASSTEYGYVDHDGYSVNSRKLPARGHLGLLCEQNSIIIKSLKIQVVGLYDTVSSYGVNFEDDNTAKMDVADLGLSSISNNSVKNVIQLAAGHEWRENFNLTSIETTGNKGLELTLPGAHADVGGCYENATYEQYHSVPVSPAKVINDQNEYNKLANEKRQPLINQGWYLDKELTIGAHTNKYVNHIGLDGKRFIDKRYSYIPLYFMCQLSDEKDAKFNLGGVSQKFLVPEKAGNGEHILHYVKTKLSSFISAVKSSDPSKRKQISYKNYLDFTNEKKLINMYVHWSATGKTGHSPRSDGKRKIVPG